MLRPWRRRDAAIPCAPRSVSRSHVGRVRTVNEDRVLDRADRGLWAVADGMGGHSAGDVAAGIAIDALAALADADAPIAAGDVRRALLAANARIRDGAGAPGSGTTIVALLAEDLRATLFWAGDSRAYAIAGGHATCLTRDHSVVQELVDAGLIDARAAARHPQANMITRALGVDAAPDIETREIALNGTDMVLLCSDGLHRSLDPRDVTAGAGLETLADRLLTNALQRDGSDNASLVLVAPR